MSAPGLEQKAAPRRPAATRHATRHLHRPRARARRRLHAVRPHRGRLAGAAYRTGLVFDMWQFQRGLTSCLFLLLSGFAFSVATTRHWASHLADLLALVKRLRRFVLFIALGYAIRVPVAPVATHGNRHGRGVAHLARRRRPPADWRLVSRRAAAGDDLPIRRVFSAVAALLLAIRHYAVGAAGLVGRLVGTPARWLAAYLTPTTGSLFPLVPWSAFILAGAALGQVVRALGCVTSRALCESRAAAAGRPGDGARVVAHDESRSTSSATGPFSLRARQHPAARRRLPRHRRGHRAREPR